MKIPKLLKTFSIISGALLLGSLTSEARWFGFTNGNLEGQYDKHKAHFNEPGNSKFYFDYRDLRLFNPLNRGFRLEALRIRDNSFRGAIVRSKKTFNGGWMITRSYTGDHDRDSAWSAFWVWNQKPCDNKLEIDLIEYSPFECQFNAYYCRQDGTKTKNPRWWRNKYHRWSCNWAKKTTGANCFWNNTKKWVGLKGRVRDANVKIIYTNRPWPFSGKNLGGFKRFGNMYVDWMEYPGS